LQVLSDFHMTQTIKKREFQRRSLLRGQILQRGTNEFSTLLKARLSFRITYRVASRRTFIDLFFS
jgi:hypothetical protein